MLGVIFITSFEAEVGEMGSQDPLLWCQRKIWGEWLLWHSGRQEFWEMAFLGLYFAWSSLCQDLRPLSWFF